MRPATPRSTLTPIRTMSRFPRSDRVGAVAAAAEVATILASVNDTKTETPS